MPRPVGCGWKQSENNELEIDWGSQPPAPEDVFELLACHCSRACHQSQCNCLQNNLSCTDACHLCLTAKTSQLFIYINDDAGDECDYHDESKNEDEWKCFYVKAFTAY